MDGICDDVDDCVGELDACGICNGPGEMYECGCSDIPLVTATAMATNSTPWVCAVVTVWQTPMNGICDDVDDCWVNSTLAASAMDQVRFTNVDVLTSLVTAIAMAIKRRFGQLRRRLRGR